jgi:hypothetical protein
MKWADGRAPSIARPDLECASPRTPGAASFPGQGAIQPPTPLALGDDSQRRLAHPPESRGRNRGRQKASISVSWRAARWAERPRQCEVERVQQLPELSDGQGRQRLPRLGAAAAAGAYDWASLSPSSSQPSCLASSRSSALGACLEWSVRVRALAVCSLQLMRRGGRRALSTAPQTLRTRVPWCASTLDASATRPYGPPLPGRGRSGTSPGVFGPTHRRGSRARSPD